MIETAISELGASIAVKKFLTAQDALGYLLTTTDQPLVILCDIRMPGMDGLSLLQKIDDTPFLKAKVTPFVFFTGIATRELVNKAYQIGVQGFYKKADNYIKLKDQIFIILSYWMRCLHPNTARID